MADLVCRHKAGYDVEKEINARVELLLPTYRNIAIAFADLHDTPIRMKAVGAIQVILNLFLVYP